jgi:cell wall-associated NlpC family hydrolase
MKRFVTSIVVIFIGSCFFMSCTSLTPRTTETVAAGFEPPPAVTPVPENMTAGIRESVLNEAEQHVDKPYVSPPGVPKNFDCSGFINYVFLKAANLNLPLSSGAYINAGVEISFADAEPGDLLIFSSVPGGNKVDHVATLYRKSESGEMRGSWLIHAVSIPTQSATIKGNPGTNGVKITELGKRGDGKWQNEYFLSRFLTCRRVIR